MSLAAMSPARSLTTRPSTPTWLCCPVLHRISMHLYKPTISGTIAVLNKVNLANHKMSEGWLNWLLTVVVWGWRMKRLHLLTEPWVFYLAFSQVRLVRLSEQLRRAQEDWVNYSAAHNKGAAECQCSNQDEDERCVCVCAIVREHTYRVCVCESVHACVRPLQRENKERIKKNSKKHVFYMSEKEQWNGRILSRTVDCELTPFRWQWERTQATCHVLTLVILLCLCFSMVRA